MKHLALLSALLMYVGFVFAQEYKPQIFGTVKAAYEYNFEESEMRFALQNTRLGLKGNVGKRIGYLTQAELNGYGKFAILDAMAELTPTPQLRIALGQQSIPFAESYVITPGVCAFSSLSYVYPYASAGSRDIGMRVDWNITSSGVPIEIQAGLFNGSGINNPKWQPYPSVGTSMIIGKFDGFRANIKYYSDLNKQAGASNYGLNLHYAAKNISGRTIPKWKVQAEWNKCDSALIDYTCDAFFLQGSYGFKVNSKLFSYIETLGRIDGLGTHVSDNGIAASRLTIGINLGLDTNIVSSLLRLNVEKVFKHNQVHIPSGITGDVISLGLLVNF